MRHSDTPIFIIAKDRKSCLETLLARLESDRLRNIFVIDTGSTYPPMVEYLGRLKFPVLRFTPKLHHAPKFVLWDFDIVKVANQENKRFIYTDCDVVPDCPSDWINVLHRLLTRHLTFSKAGLGLRLNDIPDHYAHKKKVLEHEKQFYEKAVEAGAYDSQIDTTLALYRPKARHGFIAIRTGGKYLARHIPWYYDTNNLPEEELHYLRNLHPISTFWTKRDRKLCEIKSPSSVAQEAAQPTPQPCSEPTA